MPKTHSLFLQSFYLIVGVFILVSLMPASDAFAQSTTFTYDNNGRVKTVEDTDIGVVTYDYDDVGNLTNRVVTPGGTAAPPVCNAPYIAFSQTPDKIVYPLDVCSDPNGDSLTITAASVTHGGTATVVHGQSNLDFFNLECGYNFATFTITDGNGGTAQGQVEIGRSGGVCGPSGL